ncbi:hypothetical protein M513_13801, partial [Trichuris suis]
GPSAHGSRRCIEKNPKQPTERSERRRGGRRQDLTDQEMHVARTEKGETVRSARESTENVSVPLSYTFLVRAFVDSLYVNVVVLRDERFVAARKLSRLAPVARERARLLGSPLVRRA